MNIIDMTFEQHIELIQEDKYASYFLNLMNICVRSIQELNDMFNINQFLLNQYIDFDFEEGYKKLNEDMISAHEHRLFNQYIVLDVPDPIFPIITSPYIQLYLYIELIRISKCHEKDLNKREKWIVNRKIQYLNRLLNEHEPISVLYILLAMNYYFNGADKKTVSEMTVDECAYYIELHIEDSENYDEMIDALIKFNTSNQYLQYEKEAALINAYFSKGNYERALLHANQNIKRRRVKKAIYISNAMTGNIEGFFEAFRGQEADEYTLYYPIILLAQHADTNKYGTCKQISQQIKDRIENAKQSGDIIMYSIADRIVEDRDSNYYYLAIFDFVTLWYEDYIDYLQLKEIGSEEEQFKELALIDRANYFIFADKELSHDLISTFMEGQSIKDFESKAVGNLYLKYLDKIHVHFSEDIAKFIINIYKTGFGEMVDDRSFSVLQSAKGSTDPLVKESMVELLTVAYCDVCRRNRKEQEEKLYELFNTYGIDVEDIQSNILRRTICDSLSPIGKIEYKAACIQYDCLTGLDYGINDAGMISMGFYRIIENESNERIWLPISKKMDYAEISRLYEHDKNALATNKEKSEFGSRWSSNIKTLKTMSEEDGSNSEKKRLMLGALGILIEELHQEYSLAQYIRRFLFEQLTDDGVREFNNGKLDEWYSNSTRNKFRNLPAHNKYLSLKIATEAKNYVEDQLRIMEMLIKA